MIFGAAGDLTNRLLVPALYNLRRAKLLPEQFAVIGISRRDIDDETFRQGFGESLRASGNGEVVDADLNWLAERLYHLQGEFNQSATYTALARLLSKTGRGASNGRQLPVLSGDAPRAV